MTFAILLAIETREYTLLAEQDEDGIYVGEVLELPGCHTQAPDPATLRKRIKEAVVVYLEPSTPLTTLPWQCRLEHEPE